MILATILLIILVYGLYYLRLRHLTDTKQIQMLIPAFVVFGLLLLLTGLFALSDRFVTLLPLDLDPIRTQAQFEAVPDDQEKILLVGQLEGGYKALYESEMRVMLQDGEAIIHTREKAQHFRTSDEISFANEVVIVAKSDSGMPNQWVEDIVYGGSYDMFKDFLWRAAVIPTLTMVLSFAAGFLTLALPFYALARHREQS